MVQKVYVGAVYNIPYKPRCKHTAHLGLGPQNEQIVLISVNSCLICY